LSDSEHLTLVVGLVLFQLVFALATAVIAWRKGRNGANWFLVGLVPIVGLFAVLFFLVLPREAAEAEREAAQPTVVQGRKEMSPQERRLAFALICYLIAFTLVTGPIKMPGWLRTLLYLAGCVVVIQRFGPKNEDDKPKG
jgi:4-hydroxybenzoate polyprenyltransferase